MPQKIYNEIKRLESAIKHIEKTRENDVEGSLNIVRHGGRVSYRQKTCINGVVNIEYLKKGDKRIPALAQKRYYKKLYPVLVAELNALKNQNARYRPKDKYKVYEELGSLKEFVKPLVCDDENIKKKLIEQSIRQWEQNGVSSSFYSETKRIVTDDGNKVRSKSEALIYNILLKYSNRLKFKYENELYISSSARPIRPDFEIISLQTGEVLYWEHIGMVGIDEYERGFVKKMNNYYLAGIYPRRETNHDI